MAQIKILRALCALSFFCITTIYAQVGPTYGTDFWMGFMDTGNGIITELHISSDVSTCGKVEIPKQSWSTNFTVAAGSTTVVVVPSNLAMASGSENIENKGVHVTSLSPVNVVSFNHRISGLISEGSLILPTASLGTDYYAFSHDGRYASQGPEIMIVGVENNTTIQVVSKAQTTLGKPINVPFSLTINQGEVYQIKSPGYFSGPQPTPPGDFTGTRVTSTNNKPFGLIGGNYCSDISSLTAPQCCCDPLIEQYLPISAYETKYITAPIKTRAKDHFKILASQNGTTFQINNGAAINLNADQHIDTLLSIASLITSNNPISVTQYSRSGATDNILDGDPFMIQLHPISSMITNAIFTTITTEPSITFFYVNVITKTANKSLVLLDGVSVGASFNPVAADPSYSFAQITTTPGSHALKSDSGFIAITYGYGGRDGYGYHVGAVKYGTSGQSTLKDTIVQCPNINIDFTGYALPPADQWNWNFGDGNTANQQNPTHTYTVTGTYTVTLVSTGTGFSCSDTIRIPVAIGAGGAASITGQTSFCIGDSVTLTAASTTGPYLWSNGATTQSITVSPSSMANYEVVVGTATCKDSAEVTVTPTAQLNANITSVGPFCENDASYTLTAASSGGVWSGTGITNTTTGVFDPNTAGTGTHQITYTISGSCGDTATVALVVNANADATINSVSTLCVKDAPINITSVQSGGVWSGTGITNASNGTFSPAIAGAGTHTITYTISGACGDVAITNVVVDPQLSAEFTDIGTLCIGDGKTGLIANVSGGVWSGTGVTDAVNGLFDPAVAGIGSHAVSYTLAGNCGDTVQKIIVVQDSIKMSAASDTVLCGSGSVQLFASGASTYSWFPNTNLNSSTIANPVASPTITTTYSVSTFSGSCPADTAQVTVAVAGNPTVNTGPDQTILQGGNTTITASGGTTYSWTPSIGLNSSNIANPIASPSETTTYVVTITDTNGCTDSDSVTVIVDQTCLDIYLPTAFSPNNDLVNDYLSIRGNCIAEIHLLIYNRWGEKVYETSDPNFKWDGKLKSSDENSTVLTYRLEIITTSGNTINRKGNITVVR